MNEPVIEIVHMNKKIKAKYLLKDVNLTINKGEFVVLLGQNGAGKSTLIKCITGLYKLDEGEIVINGMKWNRKNGKKIKQLISYIPDKVNFDLNLTVYQNLLYHASLYGVSPDTAKQKIEDLLKLFDLYERRSDYINKLSYGMQKKALIIRGLLSSPSILVFDEPTLGLDPKAKQDLLEKIMELNKIGITVILSTQSLQVANQSNKVIYIDNGRVNDIGSVRGKIELEKEHLLVSIGAINEEYDTVIKEYLRKNEFVYEVCIDFCNIDVTLRNSNECILTLIGQLLELDIIIYSIEFGNVSYMSLYQK